LPSHTERALAPASGQRTHLAPSCWTLAVNCGWVKAEARPYTYTVGALALLVQQSSWLEKSNRVARVARVCRMIVSPPIWISGLVLHCHPCFAWHSKLRAGTCRLICQPRRRLVKQVTAAGLVKLTLCTGVHEETMPPHLDPFSTSVSSVLADQATPWLFTGAVVVFRLEINKTLRGTALFSFLPDIK
jgi:hypothetical protein